jgi:hypothetical protein
MVRKKYEIIVNELSEVIQDKFSKKGLVSLYLAGTFLTKDRLPSSDIDFFGFVDKSFDIKKEEAEINNFFDKNKKKVCSGIECRFRAIGLDEFSGRVKRGNMTNYIGIRGFGLVFPFWKKLWGQKIDFTKVRPYSLINRKRKAIGRVLFVIGQVEKGNDFFIRGFPKEILRLAEIESEIVDGMDYEYSYLRIVKRFSGDKEHVVHEAMRFRKKGISKKEFLKFLPRVLAYVEYMDMVKNG